MRFPRLAAALVTLGLLPLFATLPSPAAAATPPEAVSPAPESNGDQPTVVDLSGDTSHEAHDDARVPGRQGIRHWPGRKIRYWTDVPKSYRWSVDAGVAAWNRTGLDITFVPASKAKAKLTITVGNTHGNAGLATIGYQRENWVRLAPGLMKQPKGAPASREHLSRMIVAHITTHELGHNLGLEHKEKPTCGLMASILYVDDCPLLDAKKIGYYRCQLVDNPSLDRTVSWYSGRRTLAPRACALDRIPGRLKQASFTGGLQADEPVQVSWAKPGNLPSGSRVEILRWRDCDFPVIQDPYGAAVHRDGVVIDTVSPAARGWVETERGTTRYCYGAQVVNRSGGGPAAITKKLQQWAASPAPPTVGTARRLIDDESTVRVVDVEHNESFDLLALVGPTCATTWPAGTDFDEARVAADDGTVDLDIGTQVDPCISFFTLKWDELPSRTSASIQLGAEPLSPSPDVTSVRREPAADTWRVQATWQEEYSKPAVVVGPEGECAVTWPGERGEYQTPETSHGTFDVSAPGLVRPCFSFFSLNAQGVPSQEPTIWQVEDAPAPPAPTVDEVSVSGAAPGTYTVRATVDAAFRLLVLSGPTDSCVESWPSEENWNDHRVDLIDGGGTFSTSEPRPCLAFFLINEDGSIGPATAFQVQPAREPVPPTVTSVVLGHDGDYTASVELDQSHYGLVVLDAPHGECVAAFPAEEDPFNYLHEVTDGTAALHSEHNKACFSFFTVNADGLVSDATVWETSPSDPQPARPVS